MKTDDRLLFPSGDLATYENLLRLLKMIESGGGNASPDKHLVLFSAGDSIMTAQAVADGETITPPSVPNVKGWEKDGEPFDITTPITDNTVLTAVWDEDEPDPAS